MLKIEKFKKTVTDVFRILIFNCLMFQIIKMYFRIIQYYVKITDDYEKFVKQFYSKIYEILNRAFCISPLLRVGST